MGSGPPAASSASTCSARGGWLGGVAIGPGCHGVREPMNHRVTYATWASGNPAPPSPRLLDRHATPCPRPREKPADVHRSLDHQGRGPATGHRPGAGPRPLVPATPPGAPAAL